MQQVLVNSEMLGVRRKGTGLLVFKSPGGGGGESGGGGVMVGVNVCVNGWGGCMSE